MPSVFLWAWVWLPRPQRTGIRVRRETHQLPASNLFYGSFQPMRTWDTRRPLPTFLYFFSSNNLSFSCCHPDAFCPPETSVIPRDSTCWVMDRPRRWWPQPQLSEVAWPSIITSWKHTGYCGDKEGQNSSLLGRREPGLGLLSKMKGCRSQC